MHARIHNARIVELFINDIFKRTVANIYPSYTIAKTLTLNTQTRIIAQ